MKKFLILFTLALLSLCAFAQSIPVPGGGRAQRAASGTPTDGQVPTWNAANARFQFSTPSGSGDFVGPASSTNNNLIRFSGTTGKLGKDSSVIVDDSGNISTPGTATFGASGVGTVGLGSAGVNLSTANNGDLIITGNGNGTDEDLKLDLNSANVGTFTSSTGLNILNFSSISLQASGVAIPTISSTDTLTGKTYDAAGTGNVLKFTDYKDFIYPHRVDGAGATIVTNDYTSGLSGLATFAGSGSTNANYAVYRIGTVPPDLDTAVAMTLKGFSIRVSGTDTDAAEFSIGLFSPASSASYTPTDSTSASTYINFDSGTLTSPAANDVFYFADVTLTGWASALTAGRPFIIVITRRDGNNDDSVTVLGGTIAYGRTM